MNKSNSTGIGFTGALTILFIAMKLLKIISWSWVWVLAPIWIQLALVIVLIIIVNILSS